MKKNYIRILSALIASAALLSACDEAGETTEIPRLTIPESTLAAAQTTLPETTAATTASTVTTQSNIPTISVPTENPATAGTTSSIFDEVNYSAEYVLLYDITDEQILYLTGADEIIYPASITKLLTVQYALSIVPDTEEIFTVGEEVNWIAYDSSKAYIQMDEQYTMMDLLYCMLLPSGNDAAYSVAVNCGLRLAENEDVTRKEAFDLFIEGMNRYGKEVLGLEGTNFDSPDGYHSDNHYTTMVDLLRITLGAYKNPVIAQIAATTKYTAVTVDGGRSLSLSNTNQLLQSDSRYYYPYANGMKTGFHSKAGSCVAVTAEKDGIELLALIMKSPNNSERFVDAITLLDLGFEMLDQTDQAA